MAYNPPLIGDRLLKHYNVLFMVVVLLVGAWAIVVFHQKSRRFPDARLRDLLRFLIFYNIFELEVFLLIYFDSNLTATQSASFFSWFKDVDWPLRTLLILCLYISQYKTIAWLRGKRLQKWVLPGLVLFTVALMAVFFLDMHVQAFLPTVPYLSFWNLYIGSLNLVALVWLIRLWSESRRDSDPGRGRVNRAFAWLFLFRIPFFLAIVLLYPGKFNYWSITFTRLLVLYTNLIPLFWLKAYFAPWAGSLGKIIAGRVDLPALQKRHGLSAREMEILGLMLDGKSYKEMEETLHISIHTVKSHAYNLYRKLGVKSRHQLIHLVSNHQPGNP